MWKTRLVVKHRIKDRVMEITLSFDPPYTYNNLYNDILILMDEQGYPIPKLHNITFSVCDKMTKDTGFKIVEDWDCYLYQNEIIQVDINKSDIILYGVYDDKGNNIYYNPDINEIYNKGDYIKHIESEYIYIHALNEPGKKIKLVDVIPNTFKIYNNTVTRLVRNYKW
jgi:hypothetical protein